MKHAVVSALAVSLLAGCGPSGKTNGQAVQELRPLFEHKAAALRDLAAKLPPASSVKQTSLPKTLDPPLIFYYRTSGTGPDATRLAKTLDFTAVETLVDPRAKRACGMYAGHLATCIDWTSPTGAFANQHARMRDGVTAECQPELSIRYVLAIRVTNCGEITVTDAKSYSADPIDYEAFLADLTTGEVIGQIVGRAMPPDSVRALSSPSGSDTREKVESLTRQEVHDGIARLLNAIPGSQVQ